MQIERTWVPKTIVELHQLLPEGTLAEIIEDGLHVAPAPDPQHQRTSIRLTVRLETFLEETGKGELFVAPIDVYLDQTSNVVQPDLLVVLHENLSIVDYQKRINGVPDLIIELLSTNKSYDLIKKRDLYARFGVKEYFVIDPETKLVMHFLPHGDGSYKLVREEIGLLHSDLLGADFRW